jgi:type I restriction enzyme S subunit
MKSWPTKKIGDLAETVMGQAPPGSECNFDRKGIPFIKAGEFGESRPLIREWTTRPMKLAKSSDVLVCVVGATCGKLNLGLDCAIGRSVAAIRPNESLLNQGFLYAFLQGWTLRLRSGSQGSAQGVITRDMLESIPIPVPPLAEQERIVNLLDEADELRKLRVQADSRTAALIPALFNQLFGDSEARGWKEYAFGDLEVMEIIDGDRGQNYPKKTDFCEKGYCLFLNTSNVRQGTFDFSKCDFINREKDDALRKGKLNRDDVVLTTRGTLGNSAHYTPGIKHENVRINSGMVILRANSSLLLPEYLLVILNSDGFTNQVSAMTSGSAQPQLPINRLSKIKFALPPLPLQKEFVARVGEIRTMQVEQAASRKRLDDLFQSILHRAFNGEL